MIANGNDGMIMPVTPMYGNGGSGLGGDWGSWIILFLIFGMFGGNGWGNNGNNGANPWLLAASQRTDEGVQAGFNQAALTGQLSGIQSSLTNGFANAEVAGCNRAMNQMQTAYENQIASMNQRFADVTAVTGQMNNIATALQNCCCENRASIADLKYNIATEGCADRNALNLGVRDLLTNSTANTQAILDSIRGINDKLCAQELQAERRENENLRQQLNMAQLASSQNLQTQQILAGQEKQATLVEQYVRPVAMPAYIVQNPNCAYPTYGCGYGA